MQAKYFHIVSRFFDKKLLPVGINFFAFCQSLFEILVLTFTSLKNLLLIFKFDFSKNLQHRSKNSLFFQIFDDLFKHIKILLVVKSAS